jgi:hypothetical protein
VIVRPERITTSARLGIAGIEFSAYLGVVRKPGVVVAENPVFRDVQRSIGSMSNFYYVLKDKHTLPRFVVLAVGSWVIALGAMTIVGIAVWLVYSTLHFDVLNALPRWLSLTLGLCGAYAGLGAICLYVTMWVYWIAVQRGPLGARIGWSP